MQLGHEAAYQSIRAAIESGFQLAHGAYYQMISSSGQHR